MVACVSRVARVQAHTTSQVSITHWQKRHNI